MLPGTMLEAVFDRSMVIRRRLEDEMEFKTIEVKQITPRVGADVTGVDLTAPLPAEQVREIEQALAEYCVLRFTKQKLDLNSLKAFGRNFGDLHIHTGMKGMQEHPEVTAIWSDETMKHVNGEDWHSDLSCDPIPPLGSILHMKMPAVSGGGDTGFASMYAAYDALSDRMKSYLEGLTATHDGHFAFSRYFPDGKFTKASHPVINTHPVSGRKGIYVNRGFTSHINELPMEEGKALLAFLVNHCARPEWSMRFRWEEDTVAFWDNRCAQHIAIWDYFPSRRSGFRVQVAGKGPIVA
jgi:taurine dioxygenase